ncbi:MAG: hypothetical protein PWQ23_522 [Thermoanaerobacter sp.]|jgi:hypothetical protein|nr:hypothetical protein [Thermoanaerobacter sp.]
MVKGKIGAVYILKAAPASLEKEPDDIDMTQEGVVFLWEVEVDNQSTLTFSNGISNEMPEEHNFITGWRITAEAFWGSETFFKNKGRIAFIRLFISSGSKLDCIEGYVEIPTNLEGSTNKINKAEITFTGLGPIKVIKEEGKHAQ